MKKLADRTYLVIAEVLTIQQQQIDDRGPPRTPRQGAVGIGRIPCSDGLLYRNCLRVGSSVIFIRISIFQVRLEEMTPGTKLGPYEILSPLGAGGMGEVDRARETRLERIVAIKPTLRALNRGVDIEPPPKTVSSGPLIDVVKG